MKNPGKKLVISLTALLLACSFLCPLDAKASSQTSADSCHHSSSKDSNSNDHRCCLVSFKPGSEIHAANFKQIHSTEITQPVVSLNLPVQKIYSPTISSTLL